jgi:hypothetical protein
MGARGGEVGWGGPGPHLSNDGGPEVPTINAKKRRWWAPWEAVPEVQECPPSTLRNIDDGPPGR